MKPLNVLLVALLVVLGSCSGGAATCEELADDAIELIQDLIHDVEAELGDASLDELGAEEELPSLADYDRKSDELDRQADELGCSGTQMRDLVSARSDRLTATTPVGNLIIDGITGGGL